MAMKEAHEIVVGDTIDHSSKPYDIRQVERITRCFPTVDINTGKRVMGMYRFHFTLTPNGPHIDHYPSTILPVY